MFRRLGGQIRYWVKLSSGNWRVVFGMQIGGLKFATPNAQLDVWIRVANVTEFTGHPADEIRSQLKGFTVHNETDSSITLRIGDTETAAKLYGVLQQWDSMETSTGENLQGDEA